MAVDPSGGVYAAGAVNSTGTNHFGNNVAANAGGQGYSAALVKYDSSGHALAARSYIPSESMQDVFTAVTLDAAGTPCAVGYLGEPGTVDFGNGATVTGTHVPTGDGWSPLLVKY